MCESSSFGIPGDDDTESSDFGRVSIESIEGVVFNKGESDRPSIKTVAAIAPMGSMNFINLVEDPEEVGGVVVAEVSGSMGCSTLYV